MLPIDALNDIYRAVKQIERLSIPGIVIEAGCALGGSSIVICAAKKKERKLHVHDVFGQIPPPSENDGQDVRDRYRVITSGEARGISGDTYYGYQEGLLKKVQGSFLKYGFPLETYNVDLVEGLFQDTLTVDQPVAFAHIDGDWYESVSVCMERIYPWLSQNGVIIVDDYFSWSGCRKAIDEFLRKQAVRPTVVVKKRLHIIKSEPCGKGQPPLGVGRA